MRTSRNRPQDTPRNARATGQRNVQRAGNAKVFSYYRNQDAESRALHTRRQRRDEATIVMSERKRERKGRLRRLGILGAILALIIGVGAYNATFDGSVRLQIQGTEKQRLLLQDDAVYTRAATTILRDAAKTHIKASINTRSAEQAFVDTFPEIATAHIKMPFFGRHAKVVITPAVPSALFTATDGSSFILNESGRVIAPHASQVFENIPLIQDQSGLAAQLGTQALSPNEMSFIETIRYQLAKNGITVTAFTLPPTAKRIHVHLEGLPYEVRFTFYNDAKQQAGSFIALQRQLNSDGVVPHEYIDVRVEGRAYYR